MNHHSQPNTGPIKFNKPQHLVTMAKSLIVKPTCGANVRLGVAVLDAGKRSGREAAEHRAALRSTTAPHPARGRYWLVLPSTSVFCVITLSTLAITAFLSTHASQNSCVRVQFSMIIVLPQNAV